MAMARFLEVCCSEMLANPSPSRMEIPVAKIAENFSGIHHFYVSAFGLHCLANSKRIQHWWLWKTSCSHWGAVLGHLQNLLNWIYKLDQPAKGPQGCILVQRYRTAQEYRLCRACTATSLSSNHQSWDLAFWSQLRTINWSNWHFEHYGSKSSQHIHLEYFDLIQHQQDRMAKHRCALLPRLESKRQWWS